MVSTYFYETYLLEIPYCKPITGLRIAVASLTLLCPVSAPKLLPTCLAITQRAVVEPAARRPLAVSAASPPIRSRVDVLT